MSVLLHPTASPPFPPPQHYPGEGPIHMQLREPQLCLPRAAELLIIMGPRNVWGVRRNGWRCHVNFPNGA